MDPITLPPTDDTEEVPVASETSFLITLSATFSIEPLQEHLSFWLQNLDLPARIQVEPYPQLLHKPGTASGYGLYVILLRSKDWLRTDSDGEGGQPLYDAARQPNVERNIQILSNTLTAVVPDARCLLYNCPGESTDDLLTNSLSSIPGLTFIPAAHWTSSKNWHDPDADALAHVPYTAEFFAVVAADIARRVHRFRVAPRKVVVLDCDNTLWKGVCGENPIDELDIDGSRVALQKFLVRKHGAGTLLCLCSKNNDSDVVEAFRRHAAKMPLQLSHIIASRINWRSKSENIRSLAEELRLGMESFIFIDDDPLECAVVRAECPDVLTLTLPSRDDEICGWLDRIWPLDVTDSTQEDRERTALYRTEARRQELQQKVANFQAFIAELGLVVDVTPIASSHFHRVAQLNQRVNQFNCSGRRRTESEIRGLCDNGRAECVVVHVKDRFGDYGLVGVVMFQMDRPSLRVDSFLLSCRAMGRGVEHEMLRRLAVIARGRDCDTIELPYRSTGRNEPAREFLEQLKADREILADGLQTFRISVEDAALVEPKQSPRIGSAARVTGTQEPTSDRWERLAKILLDPAAIHRELKKREASTLPPRNHIVERVAAHWKAVLSVDAVGVHDNFFKLGGDSLAAVRLVARLREDWDVEFPIACLFDDPTVEAMALNITKLRMASRPADEISKLLDQVETIADAEAAAALEWLAPHSGREGSNVSITLIGVITSGRSGALAKALASYAGNTKMFGRDVGFLVVDDSRSTVEAEASRRTSEEIARTHAVPIRFIGEREKRALAQKLIGSGAAPRDVVDFALFDTERCGLSPGANRNALTLLSVGKAVFSADDDTVGRTFTARGLGHGTESFHREDPSRYRFFASRAEALKAVDEVDVDILGKHETLLGQTVEGGRVVLTFNGLIGDCAWGSPFGHWCTPMGFLMLDDDSLDLLSRTEAHYREGCTRREVLRCVPHKAVGDFSFCLTTFYAFDNRGPLPPFVPVQRGQDRILGALLAQCEPDSRAAHLPFGLLHEPVGTRKFWPGELYRTASGYDLARVMIDYISSVDLTSAGDAATRMRRLGAHLMEVGSLEMPDFESLTQAQARRTATAFIESAWDRIRKRSGYPSYWAEDLKKYIGILDESSMRPSFWIPLDLNSANGDPRQLTRNIVHKFGRLLSHWPDIVDAGRNLGVEGIGWRER